MNIKLIYRYIIGEVLKAFIVITLGILIFILISTLIDEVPMLLQHNPPMWLIVSFFMYKAPFYAAESIPFAMLLTILFVFSQLSRSNELIAMKSLGISFYKIVAPVLILSFVISVFAILINETFVSATYDMATYIKESLIEKKSGSGGEIKNDLAKLGSNGMLYYIKYFDSLLGIMRGICIMKIDKDLHVIERLDAKEGKWQQNKWVFTGGVLRTFKNDAEEKIEQFSTYDFNTEDAPSDFIVHKRSPEDTLAINIFRLRKLINILKESGFDFREEEVNYNLKLAFPFATFILALLGVSLPFLFSSHRSFINAALGFIFTVVISFFYMGFITIGISAGKVGVLSPIVSAWISNILFTIIGVIFLYRVRK